MIYDKKIILDELKQKLTLKDRILLFLFRNYTYKIYTKGIKKGFDFNFFLQYNNYIKITLKNKQKAWKGSQIQ